MNTWVLVHLVWSLSAPVDAPPSRTVTSGMPTREWCEEVRILQMSFWEPAARRQTAVCVQESET